MKLVRSAVLMLAVGALFLRPGSPVLVQHDVPAQNIVCAGANCSLLWVNYSVESTQGDGSKVNCANTTGECYDSYDDSRKGSAGWGPSANNPIVPTTTVGPLTVGAYYGTAGNAGRVWAGVCADKGGCGSAAVAGGQSTDGSVFVCVTAYGDDRTDGHVISKELNDVGVSDDRSDYDSDAQVCGKAARP